MKILKIENSHGMFCDDIEKETYKNIKEICKDDVLNILDYLYNSDIFEIDKIDECHSIPNPAEKLIYANLYEQLEKFFKEKDIIRSRIDSELKEAEEKYV